MLHYEHRGISLPSQIICDNESHAGILPWDQALAQKILGVLLKHYPGHPWRVQVSAEQKVAVIKHGLISQNYGMVHHLDKIQTDASMWWVVRYGGEMLERWGLLRKELQEDAVQTKIIEPQFNDIRLVGRG